MKTTALGMLMPVLAGTVSHVYALGDSEEPQEFEESKIVLSEVAFDPPGPDAGNEWVEFAVTNGSGDLQLEDYTLVDENGAVLHKFGRSLAATGDTILLVLGPVRPGLASLDLSSDHSRILFTGGTADASKDQIGTVDGALGLRDPSGELVDFVTWSASGSLLNGSLYQEAVATAEWKSTYFVDLSFGSGAASMPGETIGRRRHGQDANQHVDWGGNGGPDAVGKTPGTPNSVDVESQGSLAKRAQEVVNATLMLYGSHPSEGLRFRIKDGSVDNFVLTNAPGFSYSYAADHAFSIDDDQGAGLQLWTGNLDHEFVHLTWRSYRIRISGTISAPNGDSLELDFTLLRSGYSTDELVEIQEAEMNLVLAGVSYPFNSSASTKTVEIAHNKVRTSSDRSEQNWGGPGNLERSYSVTEDYFSQEKSSLEFTIEGLPFGFELSSLGGSHVGGSSEMLVTGSSTRSAISGEDYVVEIQNADFFLDGSLRSQILKESGSRVGARRTQGVEGDIIGEMLSYSNIEMTEPSTGLVDADYGHSETTVFALSGGRLTADTFCEVSFDGQVYATGEFFVDPPVQGKPTPGPTIVYSHTSYGPTASKGFSIGRNFIRQAGKLAIGIWCCSTALGGGAAGGAAGAPAGPIGVIAGAVTVAWKAGMICVGAAWSWDLYWD